ATSPSATPSRTASSALSRTSGFASAESSAVSRVRESSPRSAGSWAIAQPLSASPMTRAVSKTLSPRLRVIHLLRFVDGHDGVLIPEAIIAMAFCPGIRDPLGAVDDEHVGESTRLQGEHARKVPLPSRVREGDLVEP